MARFWSGYSKYPAHLSLRGEASRSLRLELGGKLLLIVAFAFAVGF